MQEWQDSGDVSVAGSISDDRTKVYLNLVVRKPPPIEQWTLMAGDCVHNLRCSLDAWLWGKTLERGKPLKHERSIQFPLDDDHNRFSNRRRKLAEDLDDNVLWAIEQIQPYNLDPANRLQKSLVLVRELDNQNKHRFPSVTRVGLDDELQTGIDIEFEDEEAARAENPATSSKVEANLPPLVDGGRLLTYTARSRIKSAKVNFGLTLRPQFEFDGEGYALVPVLRGLMDDVATVLAWLNSNSL